MKKLENLTNQQKIEIFENVLKTLYMYEKTGKGYPYICWHLQKSINKIYGLFLPYSQITNSITELLKYKPMESHVDMPYWDFTDTDSRKKAVTEIIENLKKLEK